MTTDFSLSKTKMIFQQLPTSHKEELLLIASLGMRQEYNSLSLIQTAPLKDLDRLTFIEMIHESWLEEVLLLSSRNDQLLYLSSFPKKKALIIIDHLKIEEELYTFDDRFANFILEHFFLQFFDFNAPSPPPLSLLPEEKLLVLLKCSHEELIKICRFLGLYDIYYELKRVLKGSVLKQLEESLSTEEASYLREIGQERGFIPFADIGLNHWSGDKELLRQVILHRGLNRLAKALAKSSSHLFWYIMHILDTEHGREIQKLRVDLRDTRMHSLLEDQVINGWKKTCTASH
jgi:hypothetical protein